MDKLLGQIFKLGAAWMKVVQKYTKEERYLKLLYSLGMETDIIIAQWKSMKSYLRGLELLQTRKKRSVLPIIEKALSILFATVLEDDVRLIQQKLGEVKKKEKVLVQVARNSISILNVTRVEIIRNRESVNWLIGNLREVRQGLIDKADNVMTELHKLSGFIQQYI